MDFKRAHRILVVSGYEDDGHIGANQFQDIESGQFGHLHVEKDQIRFVFRDGLHDFHAVRAFSGNIHLGMGLEKFANHVAREFLVIHEWREAIQIDEQQKKSENECAGARYGFQASKRCLPGHHAVLLKGEFLAPKRE